MDISRRAATPVSAQERQRGIVLGPEHTRVPNQLLDLVLPRLSPSEQACLLYILRRTYGFASPADKGERKQWDRIALSQFVSGNESGGFVLDLGTGLNNTTVIRALGQLEKRGLVRISYECPTVMAKGGRIKGCGWNEGDDDHLTRPLIDPKTNAHRCPRCGRTLSKAYALRTLTPGFVKRFLTATDPKKREWNYNPEIERFYVGQPIGMPPRPVATDDEEADPDGVRQQLWFPEKLDKIIEQAAATLKSKRISDSRKINGFYLPVLNLQEEGLHRDALAHGLDEVIKRKVAQRSRNRNWHAYAKVVAQSWMEKQYGSKEEAKVAVAAAGVEQELRRCAGLNAAGEKEHARQALHDLLSNHLDQLTEEFSHDRALARRHILEAFKRGIEDYQSVREYTISTDYLPEWVWEADKEQIR